MYLAVMAFNLKDKEGRLHLMKLSDIWKCWVCEKVYDKVYNIQETKEFTDTYEKDKRDERIVGSSIDWEFNKKTKKYERVVNPIKVVSAYYYNEEVLQKYFGVSNKKEVV
jgi:hypothetical protein